MSILSTPSGTALAGGVLLGATCCAHPSNTPSKRNTYWSRSWCSWDLILRRHGIGHVVQHAPKDNTMDRCTHLLITGTDSGTDMSRSGHLRGAQKHDTL